VIESGEKMPWQKMKSNKQKSRRASNLIHLFHLLPVHFFATPNKQTSQKS